MIEINPILLTDAYKNFHSFAYPVGTTKIWSYAESRGSASYLAMVFFGLQGFIKDYLLTPITQAHLDKAAVFCAKMGVPINVAGFQRIIDVHGGYYPVRIMAVREGTVLPLSNAVVTLESTDPELPWVATYLETILLRAIWYASTIATKSFFLRKEMDKLYGKYADSGATADFGILDFSARGCTSREQNQIGGAAHLTSFLGSDSIAGIEWANENYGCEMAGFSVNATEHSIMTAYGQENELESFKRLLSLTPDGGTISVVSDSWDIYRACHHWDDLGRHIESRGITLVVRPDSGNPKEVLPKMIEILPHQFTTKLNDKGLKVFTNLKLLWGDGINEKTFKKIAKIPVSLGYGPEILMLGSGGGLLQNVGRDDMKWAFKASGIEINGTFKPIFKDPITDAGKRSKRGKLMLIKSKEDGSIRTVDQSLATQLGTPLLETVYENGKLLRDQTFEEVRNLIKESANGL